MRLWTIIFALLLTVWSSVPAFATCELPPMRTDERPGVEPTEVTASFLVMDFLGVNDLSQEISVDLRLTLEWQDPRLIGLEGCRFGLGDVWIPALLLANSSNLREGLRRGRNRVSVLEDGHIQYFQRYTGEISSYHNLHDFPFDRHVFRIEILAPDLAPSELKLRPDAERTAIANRLNIEGWDVKGVTLTEEEVRLAALGRTASVLTLGIEADRNPTYHVFRVLLPLLFVVAMSWTIFWVPPERFEFQIGLGATAMLTTIAFSLSIASKLPDLGYLTSLDKMLIWAVFLVFLSMVEALAAGLWVLRGRTASAERLDVISRFAFPALLFAGWAFAAV